MNTLGTAILLIASVAAIVPILVNVARLIGGG